MIVVAVDIGSTWTKGAAFSIARGEMPNVRLLRRAHRPTTTGRLADGFLSVLQEIAEGDPLELIQSGQVELRYSSSAKGGLAVAAIGLVPEVTLEVGKIAAQSAGARLTQVFSYQLTRQDIAGLEAAPPDILLFAGGTDGGNTRYVLANAEAIARSRLDCHIVYAGNRAVADEVGELLAHKRLRIVDNLLPNFDEPNPEPAREALRAIFIDSIVHGKGLDHIMAMTGAEPLPTPYAVLEYARAIREHVPGWEEFVLIDLGGATTDVYSAHQENPAAGTVMRGLPEPLGKRSVEGDVGLGVSVGAACQAGGATLAAAMAAAGIPATALADYVQKLSRQPDHLPLAVDKFNEYRLDSMLAGVCLGQAVARHAGRWSPVYTADGEVQVQTGRDLRQVRKVIGSGGWLARATDFSPAPWLADYAIDERSRQVLLPQPIDYFRDAAGLFPLLANLARVHPAAAARFGIDQLAGEGYADSCQPISAILSARKQHATA